MTELVLFLILTFAGSTIRNSWAIPVAAATRTIREPFVFKGSYISSRLYGNSSFIQKCKTKLAPSLQMKKINFNKNVQMLIVDTYHCIHIQF